MKKLSTETTRYMMDVIAYTLYGSIVATTEEEPNPSELELHSRMLFSLYCKENNLLPNYNYLYDIDDYKEFCNKFYSEEDDDNLFN